MIYIVEDDDNIRELVVYTLSNTGLAATGFSDAEAFWAAMQGELPELVLLDIMLPGQDGLSILQQLRSTERTKQTPVILLSAKGAEMDKVKGFECGADDYIAKPFGMMELVVRVKARLRERPVPQETSYTIGALFVCPHRHTVQVDGVDVALTLKEFEMLCFLLENRGVVLTRGQILDRVWGYAFDGESRTVDVHIRTLRQKLGKAGALVETVRGIGYKVG